IPYDLKDITNLKVTGSIKKSYNQIADAINTKFRSIRNKRHRKLEPVEEIENGIDTSSITEEHVESSNNNEVSYTRKEVEKKLAVDERHENFRKK
ncbi:8067_t:CDS:1, partial [Racocetra fulgida]